MHGGAWSPQLDHIISYANANASNTPSPSYTIIYYSNHTVSNSFTNAHVPFIFCLYVSHSLYSSTCTQNVRALRIRTFIEFSFSKPFFLPYYYLYVFSFVHPFQLHCTLFHRSIPHSCNIIYIYMCVYIMSLLMYIRPLGLEFLHRC